MSGRRQIGPGVREDWGEGRLADAEGRGREGWYSAAPKAPTQTDSTTACIAPMSASLHIACFLTSKQDCIVPLSLVEG